MPASIKHLTDEKLNLSSLLARWKDGLYYTAAVVDCDKAKKRCLVCFEDGSEMWLNNRDVHLQLSLDQLSEDEDIVCCVCDDGTSEEPNEIILCDVCNQGYHQRCHNPPVDSSKIDESEEATDHKDWFCATCSYILNQSNREKLSASAAVQQQQQSKQAQKQSQQQPAQTSRTSSSSSPQTQPKTTVQSNSQVQSRQTPPAKQADNQRQQRETPTQQVIPAKRSPASKEDAPTTTSPSGQKQQQQIPKDQLQKSQSQQQQQQPQQQSQPAQQAQSKVVASNGPASNAPVKSAVKVKQTPTIAQQAAKQQRVATTIGAVRSVPDVRQAPYPPVSRPRVANTSSTATLASMTASSALVVGGSSGGRSKQDLVNQSNSRNTVQRQRAQGSSDQTPSGATFASANNQASPVKHAVRKSGVNFNPVAPVKQSALPTATRSILPISAPQGLLAGTVPATPVIVNPPSTSVATPKKSPSATSVSMFGPRLTPPAPQYLLGPTSLSPLHATVANPRLVVPRVNNEPPQQAVGSSASNVTVGLEHVQNHTNLIASPKLVVAESVLSGAPHGQHPMVNNSNNDNGDKSNNNSEDNVGSSNNNNNRSGAAPAASLS